LLKLLNKKGGVEIVTRVHNIPKGSRLAVSTTLLATIITRLMRFSGQIHNQTGPIDEADRRVVASRAILGEWLGGSGGGWQDSGGLWPGIKVITGKLAEKGNPEFGVSRGCLLPEHTVFNREEIGEEVETKILSSIVLVHGGISQDVGPILEMVTEKYLLKYDKEWNARLRGIDLFGDIVKALKTGDMREVGRLVSIDWESVIQDIVPWVNNAFTDDLIHKAKSEFMEDYWGFLMLGGMSGGGMAFIVNPSVRDRFKERIADIMNDLKNTYARSLPFIIDPVVYDFDINHEGIIGRILSGKEAVLPVVTYPDTDNRVAAHADLDEHSIRNRYGFDRTSHDHIKNALKGGKIGLIQNRMSMSTSIEDVEENAIYHFESGSADKQLYDSGLRSLMNNEVAVITFAGGTGSRWTHGAAVVKPINPFVKIYDAYRSFIEIHLSKSTKTGELSGQQIPHAFTTSYLTHDAIAAYLKNFDYFGQKERVYLSQGKSIGLRVYPMERDLRFYWHEQLQQKMDDNVQKVQDAQHNALIEWARSRGEGEDYAENRPVLRFNPPGHWYEIPNLIKNGVLAEMIHDNPGLTYLLCHNIDTLGAYIEPALLGMHIKSGSCMMCEVTPRRFEDAGGGLAKVDGHIQLVEGLALPREEDEFRLSYYNTLTNWITIDSLLDFFGLNRDIILEAKHSPEHQNHIIKAIQHREKQVPTYVTIKNVKYLWGSGQEDVYPVAQFEKLWGDMTGLKDIKVSYVSVSRYRGLQLKEPALLDMWANDGSLDYIIGKCAFQADTAKSKNCTF
jgi:galactokinase/mevalonate kinase-like predicted kinase